MPTAAGPSVTSRVADILETVAGHRDGLALSDIARRAGLPLTTTHRLVGELSDRHLLERNDRGRYQIGLRLWEIASGAPRSVGLREAALPIMEDLYEATHENVQLAVIDGLDAVYVERISGRKSVHVVTRPGQRLPLHATGVGLVLLAFADDEVQETALISPLARYTRWTITDPRRLRRLLADVRHRGYAISERQIENISTSIAAPVRNQAGAVVAALSVVVPAADNPPAQYVPAVVAAARGISRVLA
ncbi:IclR family transcriptional regulator [Acidothermaceae bacterium B102]|nr:IclR family transcriptional regulator [Acidothermaceae bacterium B102]